MSADISAKRVLLVNPNTEKAPYPVVPVGLCLTAASLLGRYEVRIWDGTFAGTDGLQELIRVFAPDFVGIGIRNIDDVTSGSARFYIDEINRDFIPVIRSVSAAPVILGGAGFNLFPKRLLAEIDADFGVVGEGEQTLSSLLDALVNGRDPSKIASVVTRETASQFTFDPSEDAALHLPFSTVDRFLDFSPYRARGSYPIQTKRGCKLGCVYCSYPLIEGRSYRLRPPTTIVDEIEQAADRLGPVMFEFVDSTFNAPLSHAEAICEEIIRRGLSVRLRSMGVNPGGITDRLLDLMRQAGFAQIVCSADTADERTLKAYCKGFTRKQLEAAAMTLCKHDMPTMWSFIFGGPSETVETIESSFDFIECFVHPLDMVHMTEGIRIYPRTPIYDIAVQEGVISPNDELFRPVFYFSPALGAEALNALMKEKSAAHPNCIRSSESGPGPERIARAAALRQEHRLDEPMFRTLLRVRRTELGLSPFP